MALPAGGTLDGVPDQRARHHGQLGGKQCREQSLVVGHLTVLPAQPSPLPAVDKTVAAAVPLRAQWSWTRRRWHAGLAAARHRRAVEKHVHARRMTVLQERGWWRVQ